MMATPTTMMGIRFQLNFVAAHLFARSKLVSLARQLYPMYSQRPVVMD